MSIEFDPRTGFAQKEDKIAELLVPLHRRGTTPSFKAIGASGQGNENTNITGDGAVVVTFDDLYMDWEKYSMEYPPGMVILPGKCYCTGKGREGKGREGKGREGKGREGKGREGKGRGGEGRGGEGRGGEGRGGEGRGGEGRGGEGRGGEGRRGEERRGEERNMYTCILLCRSGFGWVRNASTFKNE